MRDKIIELSVGQSVQDGWVSYQCPFCKGRSRPILNIKKDIDCITAHCWSVSCESHGYKRFPTGLSGEDLRYELENKANVSDTGGSESTHSIFYTYNIPKLYLEYLGKYFIGKDLYRKYRIGYSKFIDRLIIPVEDGYLARSETKLPKWLNMTSKPFITGVKHNILDTVSEAERNSRLFIVEDPLSAIRLGEFVPTLALLGTNFSTIHTSLCAQYRNVCIWLDPDKAGYAGMLKIKNKLSVYCNVTICINGKEPKELTDYQLKEIIRMK